MISIQHELQLLCPPDMDTNEARTHLIDKLLASCPDAMLTDGAPSIKETPEMVIATIRFTSQMFDHAYSMAIESVLTEVETLHDWIDSSPLPSEQKQEYHIVLGALTDRISDKYQIEKE